MQICIVHANRFAGQIQYNNGSEGADQKYNIEPTVIEVEVQIAKDFCNNHTILGWHIHAHQQNWWAEIHAHNLTQNQYNNVAWFAGWNTIEEL